MPLLPPPSKPVYSLSNTWEDHRSEATAADDDFLSTLTVKYFWCPPGEFAGIKTDNSTPWISFRKLGYAYMYFGTWEGKKRKLYAFVFHSWECGITRNLLDCRGIENGIIFLLNTIYLITLLQLKKNPFICWSLLICCVEPYEIVTVQCLELTKTAISYGSGY